MRKGVAFAAFVLAAMFAFSFYAEPVMNLISGWASGTVNVSVVPVTMIDLNASVSRTFMNVSEIQNITVDIKNKGSISGTSQLQVTVYTFNGTSLIQKALYTDSTIAYIPGLSRKYQTIFVPTEADIYFVKASLPFNSLNLESWAAFVVVNGTTGGSTGGGNGTSSGESPAPSPSSGGGGGGSTSVTTIAQVPRMNLTYDNSVRVGQADSTIVAINVKNIGNTNLNNLRLAISAPNAIDFDVNPKVVARIGHSQNFLFSDNTTFLLTITVPDGTQPGEYSLDFKVVTDELNSVGKVTVNVLPSGALDIDDIRQRILSYGLIILDIEQQMISAQSRGIDVSNVNSTLEDAKTGLEDARTLFNAGEYEKARLGLDDVRKNLERASLQLATATFFVYKPQSVPIYPIIAAVAATVAGLYGYHWYRRRNRRPKLLRGLEQESE